MLLWTCTETSSEYFTTASSSYERDSGVDPPSFHGHKDFQLAELDFCGFPLPQKSEMILGVMGQPSCHLMEESKELGPTQTQKTIALTCGYSSSSIFSAGTHGDYTPEPEMCSRPGTICSSAEVPPPSICCQSRACSRT